MVEDALMPSAARMAKPPAQLWKATPRHVLCGFPDATCAPRPRILFRCDNMYV